MTALIMIAVMMALIMENKIKNAKIYILRADSVGNVYRGYECDAQDYSDMIKIPDIQKFALTKNIDILYEEDAVIMGKTLNRAVCGEDGKVQKIFAGNIAAVKHEKDIIKDINKEDIEFVEKSLRPIERIFGGEVFFKS